MKNENIVTRLSALGINDYPFARLVEEQKKEIAFLKNELDFLTNKYKRMVEHYEITIKTQDERNKILMEQMMNVDICRPMKMIIQSSENKEENKFYKLLNHNE